MGKSRLQPATGLNDCSHCPFCRATSTVHFLFSGRRYYRCPSCDLIFAERQADAGANLKYYQNFYFDEHSGDQHSGQRATIYRQILDFLEEFHTKGSLLDVGCGCGLFLSEAHKRGWLIFGVDPSWQSIALAQSMIGKHFICGTIDDLPADRRYDAIVMINVLDHMVEGWQALKKIHHLLAPEGILYLRFPNGTFHSSVLQFSRMISAEWFVKRILIFHEYAFTAEVVRHFLRDMGFVDIRVQNSPLTGGNLCAFDLTLAKLFRSLLSRMTWTVFKSLEHCSGGRCLWGPSLHVIARKGTK